MLIPQNQIRHKNWVFTPMKPEFHTAISMCSLAHPDKKTGRNSVFGAAVRSGKGTLKTKGS